MTQVHLPTTLGDTTGLVAIDTAGQAGFHGTKTAPTRAGVAEHHEGSCPVLAPALVKIGATGFLADGVQSLGVNLSANVAPVLICIQLDTKPFGLSWDTFAHQWQT
jgi:hypothetical protein